MLCSITRRYYYPKQQVLGGWKQLKTKRKLDPWLPKHSTYIVWQFLYTCMIEVCKLIMYTILLNTKFWLCITIKTTCSIVLVPCLDVCSQKRVTNYQKWRLVATKAKVPMFMGGIGRHWTTVSRCDGGRCRFWFWESLEMLRKIARFCKLEWLDFCCSGWKTHIFSWSKDWEIYWHAQDDISRHSIRIESIWYVSV